MRTSTKALVRLAPEAADARAAFGLAARLTGVTAREARFAAAVFFARAGSALAVARFPEATATVGWNTPARPKEIKNATHARRQPRRDPPAIAVSENPDSPRAASLQKRQLIEELAVEP
ncbi:MAG: hypothetical protein ROZ64_01820 [Burkholderiaceae bacterium]|nr:hypothetical protein [Burkholderiaceae bacterium]